MRLEMSSEKTVTVSTIAEALGISKTTVSRAISGNGRVGSETRARVRQYIEEHPGRQLSDEAPDLSSATRNTSARGSGAQNPGSLRKNSSAGAQFHTGNIGIVVPDDHAFMELPFFQSCLKGICENASSFSYETMIAMVTAGNMLQLERMVDNRKVDGIILARTVENDKAVDYLLERNVPLVTIGSTSQPQVHQVDCDHRMACREITSLLLMKKIGRMVMLYTDRENIVTKNRIKGFLEALEIYGRRNVSESECLVNATESETDRVINEAVRKKYGCIVCADDVICAMVLEKLKNVGLSVPKDIMVASFYNSTALEKNKPSITTLQFDAKQLGIVACKNLLGLIEGRDVPEMTLLGYEILMKESTKTGD